MKYMLMMNAPSGMTDWAVAEWRPADLKAHIDFMHGLNDELRASGVLVGAEGLAPPGEARLVRAGKDGLPAETDGPFPEAKEFLAGFWIVQVDSAEQAYALAERISKAPGPGGAPMYLAIEVRQVGTAPT